MSDAPARLPVFPHEHVPLHRPDGPWRLHAVELAACLGLGQRALVVGPPRSGKTTLLREVARSIVHHRPQIETHVLVVDQAVEEFMEWRADLPGATVHGTSSDAGPEEHVEIEHVFERAAAVAAQGGDALVLVDSLGSLARALNATMQEDERVLTGGLMQSALRETRSFFGAARAYESNGSLTVIAVAGIDTSNELDDVVFHELVGTGNMELRLSAAARDAGLYPALDVAGSGTRRAEAIVGVEEADRRAALRAQVTAHGETAGLALLYAELERAGSLQALLASVEPA